jgi:hypothetical protein
LQNRAGTICASTGCPVFSSALATILSSRAFRVALIHSPRTVFFRAIAIFSIESHRSPKLPTAASQSGKALKRPA